MIDVKIDFSKATADEIEAFYADADMANMVARLKNRGRSLNIAFSVAGESDVLKKLTADMAGELPTLVHHDEYHKLPGRKLPAGLTEIREHFHTKEPR